MDWERQLAAKDKGRSKRGSSDVCGRRFADGSIKNMQNTVEHIWEKILMNVMFVKKRFSVVSGYMQITLEVRTHTREHTVFANGSPTIHL
jgi:hypothetical protein